MRKPERALGAAALALLLVGCNLAPTYHVPTVPVPTRYHASAPWQPAQPAAPLPREAWWSIYHDATLDRLERQLLAGNTDLAIALAHYQQARAYAYQARSELFPQLGANLNAQRDRQSDTKPLRGPLTGPNASPKTYNSFTAAADASYELDLWGRVRNSVEAGKDSAQAAAADLAGAQLSMEAQLADTYAQLRGLDRQIELLAQNQRAYQKALELTRHLQAGGIVSGLDVARAQAQLSSARSQSAQAGAQRALLQDAIAVLAGQSASAFALAPDTQPLKVPAIPVSVPSTLLQRRPDIAAAERRTAAANAQIGIARAAYFPSISLSAQGGFQSRVYPDLLSAPNHFWALGPNLLETLFDGGYRKAQVQAARAASDAAGATYRGVVLNAFAQVEDALAQLGQLGAAQDDQQTAARAAQQALRLSMVQYQAGATSYLDVTSAQTTALAAQLGLLQIQTQRLRASVALVRALGGGWSRAELPGSLHGMDSAPAGKTR